MYQNIFHLLNKYFFVNFFFAFIPISFILGNLILNLNILLFITLSLFIYYKDFLDLKFNYLIITVTWTLTPRDRESMCR